MLSERMKQIIVGTQRSLLGRITPSGYAATSLTGAYPGMYSRDAAIQALAMLATGHASQARAILRYLVRYGADAGLDRAPQVVPSRLDGGDEAIMTDQPDGNYMFVLAWARYVAAHPQDEDFRAETFVVIARYADHYVSGPLWDPRRRLLRNPNLEHSRNLRFWNAFDLITNVFLSQALFELGGLPGTDPEQAQRWNRIAREVAAGVREAFLRPSPTGVPQYGELIDAGNDDRFLLGYSWVNFATVAAEWFAADPAVEANTYDAYLAVASADWDGHRMLSAYDDVVAATGADEVIGKGLAWEIGLAQRLGRTSRVSSLLAFVEERTRGEIFAESYYPDHVSDTGNQEQASWFIYEMARSFPEELNDIWSSIPATSSDEERES